MGHVLCWLDQYWLNPVYALLLAFFMQWSGETKFMISWNELAQSTGWVPLFQTLVFALFTCGLLIRLNRALSQRTLNNGTKDMYDWDKEIVLVTGAAGGIGAIAAQKFAARGTKVVVLDILPLTYPKSMISRYA